MTAATQILVTSLICGKLIWASRHLASNYMRVVWMLVESGINEVIHSNLNAQPLSDQVLQWPLRKSYF